MSQLIEIGRIAQVNRYPVKSMRGEALEAIDVGWSGFDGDRQYAFYRTRDGSRFPWFTARIFAELVLFSARYGDPGSTKNSDVKVHMPDGETCEVTAPTLAARLSAAANEDVGLIRLGRGTFDSMPISVVGQGMLDAVQDAYGQTVASARFRPNIIIDRGSERDWIGRCLVVGDPETGPRLRVNKPIDRCAFITVDPETAARDAKLLRCVVENFDNQVGAYCVPERLGTITVGAKVWLA
ncbi:MAG: MOSC domain-containing protein [Rhodospirillaceae bacterium]